MSSILSIFDAIGVVREVHAFATAAVRRPAPTRVMGLGTDTILSGARGRAPLLLP